MADEPTILGEAFILTEKGLVEASHCKICGRPYSSDLYVICEPCWVYYGKSTTEILDHCMKTGTMRPRR